MSFELAELTNRAYPLLPPEVQDAHQALLLDLCAPPDGNPHDAWCVERTFQALLPIPAPYRDEATQTFLDRWRPCYGNARARAELWSWSGSIRAPVETKQLLNLSDDGLRRLLRWFTDHDSERARRRFEEQVGGREELGMQLADAAALAPDRFLALANMLVADEQHPMYVTAILRGAATHLRYRFGNLNSPPDWQPAEPLPDGSALAGRILAFAEHHGALWANERNAPQVIKGLADAVEGVDQCERLAWLLLRLARAERPDADRVRFDPDKRKAVEGRDLMSDAINEHEPRGICAVSAMGLASRLTERGDPWPELLSPLLRRLASDPVASVRAGILRSLPWLHHKAPDLGWDLLARCLTAPHPALWELAGKALYLQLRDQFGRVAPYLDRMLSEAPGPADATWARLTTLALLEGHVTEETLFERLTTLDRAALWKAAADVFTANIGNPALAPVCRHGLLRILDRVETADEPLLSDLGLTRKLGWQPADLQLVARFIASIGPTRRQDLLKLPDWLATAARRDPRGTLPLLEGLASRLTAADTPHTLIDAKPLIAAMLEILREADDSGDLNLINRAIALQDRFLMLGLTDMDAMLDEAGRG